MATAETLEPKTPLCRGDRDPSVGFFGPLNKVASQAAGKAVNVRSVMQCSTNEV